MTSAEYSLEWLYIIDERRGVIAGAGALTEQEEAQAQREAREHMDAIEAPPLTDQTNTATKPNQTATL